MILIVFRSRLRPENIDAYNEMSEAMDALAATMPGYISARTFVADDDERVTIVEFETEADVARWREHPLHRDAQELGRKQFYSEYRVQVAECLRDYDFKWEAD